MRLGTLKTPTGKLPLPGTTYGPLRWVVNAATWWHQKDETEPEIAGCHGETDT